MSETNVFSKKMCQYFEAIQGAYTTMTDKEIDKETYNVKKDIKSVIYNIVGKENVPRVHVSESQKMDFLLFEDGNLEDISIPCKFSKTNRDEITIYFNSELSERFRFGTDDIWYIFKRESIEKPIIGFMKRTKWWDLFSSEDVNVDDLLNESLGFEEDEEDEYEESGEGESEEQPFDADKIRIEQQMLSVKYVYELFQSGLLDTSPNFQRKHVWNENRRKSLLIESLMLRIPIPAFYFYENRDSLFQVIDGQQRLTTIFSFLNDEFRLSGLEYLDDSCGKKKFSQLDVKYQQRIFRTQLAVNVLDARSPHKVIYDIFRRINTGGISLSPQEMRNAICTQSVREFLKNAAISDEYLEAVRYKTNDIRMDSQELFLRFVAFYRRYDFVDKTVDMKEYSKVIKLLDDEVDALSLLTDHERDEILEAFKQSMKNCKNLFGEKAFVKLFIDDEGEVTVKKDLINKSLFMSISVILANPLYKKLDLTKYREKALRILAKELQDKEYERAVSGATGDKRNVILNFDRTQEVISRCIEMDSSR